jgi:hypothetical protein
MRLQRDCCALLHGQKQIAAILSVSRAPIFARSSAGREAFKSAAPAVDIARARTYLPLIPINRSPGGA